MPTSIRIVPLSALQNHEQRTNANVRVGGYGMDQICPIGEIKCFHIVLTSADLPRVFLLWEATFIPHTEKQSCRLVDITATAEQMAMARRPTGEINSVDLINTSELEPVLVTNNLDVGPLVIIDGNHRLTAHYARFRSIDGVRVFVGVHAKVLGWKFVPPLAKSTNNPMDRSGGSAAR